MTHDDMTHLWGLHMTDNNDWWYDMNSQASRFLWDLRPSRVLKRITSFQLRIVHDKCYSRAPCWLSFRLTIAIASNNPDRNWSISISLTSLKSSNPEPRNFLWDLTLRVSANGGWLKRKPRLLRSEVNTHSLKKGHMSCS